MAASEGANRARKLLPELLPGLLQAFCGASLGALKNQGLVVLRGDGEVPEKRC